MINLFFKIFCILLLFFIKARYVESYDYFTHPINIVIDPIHINSNETSHKKILEYLNKAINILSKMVNCIDKPNIAITPQLVREKCKRKIKIINTYINTDLLIIPIIENFGNSIYNNNFQVLICEDNPSKRVQPNIALFLINKFMDIMPLTDTSNKRYLLKLEIFKYILDTFGLSFSFRLKTRQALNNFFETPTYLIEKSFSYNSIKKLYKLSDIPLPKVEISECGDFYDEYWSKDLIIKDFESENIDISNDMTETTFHLLNDLNYYSLSQCDMLYDNKGKCHRIDQKCISQNELDNNYYLKYGLHNSKIICYFSNKNNLLNSQCGNKYGLLLNEIINYSPLVKKKPIKTKKIGDYEIPELPYYEEQELKLITPSKKCHSEMPRTIYFRRNFSTNLQNLNDIFLNEENRKFFVTFQIYEDVYFNYEFLVLARFNGLIRSYHRLGNHNLILDSLPEYILKQRGNNQKINKFQKIFNYVGSEIFEKKDSLYKIYKKQKQLFENEYNFMQETYLYPEDKNIINKTFSNYKFDNKNIWIVKSRQGGNGGNSIHIFKSLKNEQKNYIITKYIHNPHLINGKKYIFQVFVLVTGLKPLRIYLNKEGLVRIATEKFNLNRNNFNNNFVHLTNTGINKKNKEYVYAQDYNSEDANKWSLNTYKKYLNKENIDFNLIIKKINDIAIKTIITGHRYLVTKLNEFNLNDTSFFNLYGFDIMIDENYQPYLLEVNRRPDMHVFDKMDKVVKEKIFIDTLNIIGMIPFSHDNKLETYDAIYKYDDKIEESVDYAYCELTRPRGSFELIFPLKDNIDIYKKYFNMFLFENERLWEKINNDEENEC